MILLDDVFVYLNEDMPEGAREMVCPIAVSGRVGRVWRGAVSADRIVLPANDAAVFEVV